MKAKTASAAKRLLDIPNIGPAMVGDFTLLGIAQPADLAGRDPLALYQQLCKKTGFLHDPCVLDTFMAAVDFMNGAPAKPWWGYTEERKRRHRDI